MTDIPHFALPFRFSNGSAVVVEQDTTDDVYTCVEAIVRYQPGIREDLPGFGLPDQVLREGGADLEEVRATLQEWEPRQNVVPAQVLEELMTTVRLAVEVTSA